MLDPYGSMTRTLLGMYGNFPGRDSFEERDLGYGRGYGGGRGREQEYVGPRAAAGYDRQRQFGSPQFGLEAGGPIPEDTKGLQWAGRIDTPEVAAWGRNAVPTPSNYLATQPRYYNYSGGSPDPAMMLMFPTNPERWDRSGAPVYGERTRSGAYSNLQRRKMFEDRMRRRSRRFM